MALDSNTPIEKSLLHDWVEEETRALDIVASWETLCDVYRDLNFSDPLSDATRMEEYKWIIEQMNDHLTRARTRLLSCTDPEAMREVLTKMFTSKGQKVSNRMNLTYHKLRQRWVSQMLANLEEIVRAEETKQEGEQDAWWNE